MLEPPPFAFDQQGDDDHASIDSTSQPQFLRTSRHHDSPPFHHRVHFDDEKSNDEEIDHAPSPLPFALSSNNLDEIEASITAVDNTLDKAVSAQHASAGENNHCAENDDLQSTLSYHSSFQEYNHGDSHAANTDSPGITILDEDNESIHRQSISNSKSSTSSHSNIRPASSSFFQTQIIDDSIVAGAAAHVDANPNYANLSSVIGGHNNGDASSILNQLMQYANNDDDDALPQIQENEIRDEQLSIEDGNENDDDIAISITSSLNQKIWEWPIQFFSSFRKKKKKQQTSSNNVPTAALTNLLIQ